MIFSLGLLSSHVQPFQNLNDPIAALAGIQAVFGLVIEVSFIATFTQRFFAC